MAEADKELQTDFWKLVYGKDKILYCSFVERRKSPFWKTADLTENFDLLWKLIENNHLKTKWGIRGNLTRPIKCLILILIKYLVNEMDRSWWEEGKPDNADKLIDTNGNVNFEVIMKPHNFTALSDFFLNFLKKSEEIIILYRELLASDPIEVAQKDFKDGVLDGGGASEDIITITIIEYLEQDEGTRDLIKIPETTGIEALVAPVPVPIVPPKDSNVLDGCFEVARTLMRAKATSFEEIQYVADDNMEVMTLNELYDIVTDDVGKKTVIFYTLIMPYLRRVSSSSLIIIGKDVIIKNITANSSGNYDESVVKIAMQYGDLIENIENKSEELLREINALPYKWGFHYGAKLLSFTGDLDIIRVFEKRKERKALYTIADIRNIYNDIFGDCPQKGKRGDYIERIVAENPHTIKNAVTFYTDDNLMAQHKNLFVKLKWPKGDVGFDLCELFTMILSSEGRNEHMGLPDMPEKGKIWTSQNDLEAILWKLHSICRTKDNDKQQLEAYNDMLQVAKSFLKDSDNVPITVTNMKSIIDEFKTVLGTAYDILPEGPSNEVYLPLFAVAYVICKAEMDKLAEYKLLLKDINLLHLIGYLGWIMLSDNASSHSDNADEFEVTNTCKSLIEKYILSILEDTNIQEQYYYSNKKTEYNPNFDKKIIISKLQELQFNGVKLDNLLNPDDHTTCLHGIAGNLIMIYLRTLNELGKAIDIGAISSDDIPEYVSKQRLKPLSVFKHLGNGMYIYAVKLYVNGNDLIDDNIEAFDYTTNNFNHDYSIQYCNVNDTTRIWVGHYNIEKMYFNDNKHDHYQNRLYKSGYFQANPRISCPYQIIAFFDRSKLQVAQLLRATDLFMQHRIEHFRIFTRYVIDFSNMLHEYYESGVIDLNGKFVDSIENKPYKYQKSDWPDIDKDNVNKENLIDILYAYYFNYMYSNEQELQEDFKKKFSQHLNVNSAVARDYEYENEKLTKKSELVYFHDIVGKLSDIFDKDIREGNKGLFGINQTMKDNKTLFSNELVKQLGKETQFKDFNDMIIKKSMMSKVLMKILDPNSINPLYMHIMDEITGDNKKDKDVINAAKQSVVKKYVFYMNIDAYDYTNQEEKDKISSYKVIGFKFLKTVIAYTFMANIVQKFIIPPMTQTYPAIASAINKIYFPVLEPMVSVLIRDVITPVDEISRENTIVLFKTHIRKMIKQMYTSLYNFLNMFFDETNPTTYNYHIVKMSAYKPLIDEIQKGIDTLEYDNWRTVMIENSEITDTYSITPSSIFPDKHDGEKEYIYKNKLLLSEITDMAFKSDLLEKITMPLSGLVLIMNKINDMELPTVLDEDQGMDWYRNMTDLLSRGTFYQDLIDLDDAKNAIGMGTPGRTKPKEKMQHLFENVLKALINTYSAHVPVHFPAAWANGNTALAVICIAAYENVDIYNEEVINEVLPIPEFPIPIPIFEE